ncbi:MAG: Ku protein [Actinobacteria bacterium]|nr:Ku protein [Actinomycetota bacterium]
MPRSIWKGAISFGLVNIPVGLFPAETRDRPRFRQLDRRTMSVIHEERRNEQNEPVPPEDIVKGYEYRGGEFVTLSDEDFRRADPVATQTIEIMAFAGADEIDVTYFERPYYLAPTKAGRKGYALLRETLRRSGRVAVARVVIRTRQYLAAVVPRGDVLVLELLRHAHELRAPDELDLPGGDLEELGVSDREIAMAEQLVAAMVEPWDPRQYRDEYREDLLRLIEDKADAGGVEPVAEAASEKPAGEVIDIMALLKRSVEERRAREGAGDTDGAGGTDGADAPELSAESDGADRPAQSGEARAG